MLSRFKQLFASNAPALKRACSATIEDLEGRKLMAASYDLGININDASTDAMQKGIPVMKKLGVQSVRLWVGVGDFNNHSWNGTLQRAIDYSNAGFDVMMIVSTSGGKVTNPSAVKGWFSWAMSNSSLKNAVDRWQIGNEPDHDQYWQGSLSSYVTNFLKPASEVLRPAGEQVVSAGPSWNSEDVRTMINAGMLNYVDYVGYHPYANGVNLAKQRMSEIKSVVAGRKPLLASEWNVRGFENDSTKWADAVRQVYPSIKGTFAINYYFALVQKYTTKAGPAGIMTSGGATTKFYSALAAARNLPSEGVTPSPTPTPTPTGTTPSTVTKPTIAGYALYDANTGKVISGYSNITSSKTIKLSSLPSRNIRVVAIVNTTTSSVKFTAFGSTITENGAPFRTAAKYVSAASYTISGTAYSADNAGGTKGNTLSITLTFT